MPTFSTGRLAREAGVSSDTIRHYERLGLLPTARRAANNYRAFPVEALHRLKLIRRALTFGFTLEELARVLHKRDRGGLPCSEVRALAAEKLAQAEANIEALERYAQRLRDTLNQWDQRLAAAPSGERAWLLESLLNDESDTPHAHPLPLPPALPARSQAPR